MQKIAEKLKILPTITGRGALLWKAGKTGLKQRISLVIYKDIISMKQKISLGSGTTSLSYSYKTGLKQSL